MKCYCKSGKLFDECCKPLLDFKKEAVTPKELMMSRYSAYCRGNIEYIKLTATKSKWEDGELEYLQNWADNSIWQHLDVVDVQDNIVEFKAYYIFDGKQHMHHERSSFVKVNNVWKYVDGIIYDDKVEFARNELCICGSGIKYKKCCYKKGR